MIKEGFTYLATLVLLAGVLVCLPKVFTGKTAQKVFHFLPPIAMIYLGLMLLCSVGRRCPDPLFQLSLDNDWDETAWSRLRSFLYYC